MPSPITLIAGRVVGHLRLMRLPAARAQLGLNVEPFSYWWGHDRGKEIYRYYLEQFLQEHSPDIRGHCLEFSDAAYTTHFGGSEVTQADVLHVDGSNPLATIVADLTKTNDIPSNLFDCIICTHVLHLVFEAGKLLSELYRILKPAGVLLAAVPHVSMCDPQQHEYWRYTAAGLSLFLAKRFGGANITVRAYGNSLTAAGQIRGLAAEEFSKSELDDHHDLRFAVEVCARAIKPN